RRSPRNGALRADARVGEGWSRQPGNYPSPEPRRTVCRPHRPAELRCSRGRRLAKRRPRSGYAVAGFSVASCGHHLAGRLAADCSSPHGRAPPVILLSQLERTMNSPLPRTLTLVLAVVLTHSGQAIAQEAQT